MFFFHGGEEGADVEWICGRIMMVKTFSIHGDVVFGSNQSSATTSLLKEVCRARVGIAANSSHIDSCANGLAERERERLVLQPVEKTIRVHKLASEPRLRGHGRL